MDQGLYRDLQAFYHHDRSKFVDANGICLSDTFGIWAMLFCDVVEQRMGIRCCVSAYRLVTRLLSTSSRLWLLEFLDTADAALLRHSRSRKAFETALYEHLQHGSSPIVLEWIHFLSPIVNGWFCRRDLACFRALHQIFAFPLRVTLEGEGLEEKAVADYEQTIALQRTQDPKIGAELNAHIRRWFPRLWEPTLGAFRPHHGPGVTSSTGRSAFEKNAHLSEVSPLLDYYIRNRGISPWFPSVRHFAVTREFAYVPEVRRDLFTKIVFVPKNWKKKRTISAEPVSNLYCQEGIKDAIIGFIHHPQPFEKRLITSSSQRRVHPLKRRYDPCEQSHNRDLAWEGSLDGSYATIDLSAASDSVSLTLVKNAFRGTGVLPALLSSRTPRAMFPNGKMVDLTAYGPMGNALTFPVETIIFCACCEVAIESTGDSSDNSRYVVYGDDIVIEARYVDSLLNVLSHCDFRVNQLKSFASQENLFRESCGAEWLHGEDVVPVRIPRGFKSLRFTRRNPGLYAGNCELANELFHFPMARRLVLDEMFLSIDKGAVPFSPDGVFGLYSPSCTNFQLEWKESPTTFMSDSPWHHGIQTMITKIWQPDGSREKAMASLSDEDHAFNWHLSAAARPDVRSILPPVLPYRQWVPMTPSRLARKRTSALYPTCT
jgi:hypothetical protein